MATMMSRRYKCDLSLGSPTLAMTDMFRSERLEFRAIEDSEHSFIRSLHQDATIQLATTGKWPVPQSKQQAQEHMDRYASSMLSAVICLPPVSLSQTGHSEPVGIVSVERIGAGNALQVRDASINVTLCTGARGKGYGTETTKWALRWAFRQAGVHKVAVHVYEFNSAAVRMCEKLGFKLDGRLRQEVWNDGRYWDDFLFSMLESEWADIYGKQNPA